MTLAADKTTHNGNGSNGNGNGPNANGSRPPSMRVPPHDLAAERAVLGTMLLSQEAVATAIETTSAGAFYKPSHGHIFDAAATLFGAGEAVDVVSVGDLLSRSGLLEQSGGMDALRQLQADSPATSRAGQYARIVNDHHLLRRLIGVAGEIAEMGYDRPADVGATLEAAEGMVFGLSDSRRERRQTLASFREGLADWLTELEAAYDRGGVLGVPTGFTDIDDMLLGFLPGQLVTVAARPGMGKTSWLVSVATHVGQEAQLPVLLVSVEMSTHELLTRTISGEGKVDHQRLRSARLVDSDWPKVSGAIGRLSEVPVMISDDPTATLFSVRSAVRRATAQQKGLGLVIVDYLQLMTGRQNAENRQVEVSELARGLKVLARDLGVPVVAAAQLNRNLEQRGDKRPLLSDLRESGEIENSSDVVAFLYRDDYYHPDSTDRGTAEFIVAKHRNGPTGMARMAWLDHYGRFANMARMV